MSEPKQVIVVRKDLNMRKGKIAAQASHSSMAALLNAGEYHLDSPLGPYFQLDLNDLSLQKWLLGRFTKIVVSVDSEEELKNIYEQVKSSGIKYHAIIEDCGLTEFHGIPTVTCIAIGPARSEEIDPLTSHLKLL